MKKILLILALVCTSTSASAATYHVAKTGSNANSCTAAQSSATPRLTIASGISCLASGDTLLIGAGSYSEEIQGNNIPSGTASAFTKIRGAGISATRVVGNNDEGHGINITSAKQFIEFSDLELDGNGVAANGINLDGGAKNLRFINLNVHHPRNQGLLSPSNVTDLFISGSTFSHAGANGKCYQTGGYCHGVYSNSPRTVIEASSFHHNEGYGIQIYPGPVADVTIKNSLIFANIGGGLVLANTSSNAKVFNNSIFGNAYQGILLGGTGHQVRNNIVFQNAMGNISGSGATQSNNLTTNPGFVNAGAGDLRLQSTSPAIDAGMTLAEVTTDFAGVARPQGKAFDIGAFEFASGETQPPEPPSDTNAAMSLTWVDNSSNETGFGIERKDPGAQYKEVAKVGSGVTSYSDTVPNPAPGGHQYCYRLYAFNDAGKSAYSNEACSTTAVLLAPPSAPSNLQAAAK